MQLLVFQPYSTGENRLSDTNLSYSVGKKYSVGCESRDAMGEVTNKYIACTHIFDC